MRKRIISILLLALIIISSCSNISSFSAQRREAPLWVTRPNVRSGRIAYISEGSGASEEAARISAIENCLEELGRDLGIDAYAIFFRELSQNSTIADLDGRISNTYYQSYGSSRYSCFIMLDISSDRFSTLQTPETRALEEAMDQIRSLVDDARSSYMQNRDIEAIESALRALLISLENDIEDNNLNPESMLDLTLYYLEPLEIRYEQNRSSIDGEISVRRRRGILFPLVYSAPLFASYPIRDSLGEYRRENISFNTGESGRFAFHNTNTYILPSGELAISLDIDTALIDSILFYSSSFDLSELETLLSSKTASFSYDERRNTSYDFDLLISHYDIHGAELDITTAIDSFNNEISELGYSIEAIKGIGESDEEVLSNYIRSGNAKARVVIIRAGVADTISLEEGRTLIFIETTLGLYDTETGELLYSDNNASSVSDSPSYDEALEDAFSEIGKILASSFIIDL